MSLSKEQFVALRKQGLSNAQIKQFQARQMRESRTAESEQPKIGTMEGFIDPFKQTAIGIGKGVGSLALGVGTMGRTLQEGAARLVGKDLKENSVFDVGSPQRATAEESLKSDTTGQGVAKFVTEVGAMAAPSAGAAKATKGLGFAQAMLGRGSVGAVTGTIQGGGDIDQDTAIGAATEVAFPVLGKTLRFGGDILKGLASAGGGTGTEVIEQVLKSPRAALQGASDDSLRASAEIIRKGTRDLKSKAGSEFAEATAKHTQQLDKDGIVKIALDYINEAEASNFKIEPGDMDKLRTVVNSWDDFSAKGVNEMASKISDFYSGSVTAVPEDRIIAGLNRTVRDWVGTQVPEIAEANAKYADKMDLLEQMTAIFKTKGNVDSRMGVQNTAQAVSRLFNANKGIVREGVEELQQELGIDVLGREAGRQLGSGTVTKFQVGDGATAVARSLIPQSAILKLSAAAGIGKEVIESRLSTLDPIARSTVIEVLTDLLGEGEGQDLPQTNQQTVEQGDSSL